MLTKRFEILLTVIITLIFAFSLSEIVRGFNGETLLYHLSGLVETAKFNAFLLYAFIFFLSLGVFALFYSALSLRKGYIEKTGRVTRELRLGSLRVWVVGGRMYAALNGKRSQEE